MNVDFNRLAEKEFLEAVAYYEKRTPGLGRRFRNAVEQTIDALKQFPESGRPGRKEVRVRIVKKRFPYNIVYSVRSDSVYIVSVMHQKRRPSHVYSRLSDA